MKTFAAFALVIVAMVAYWVLALGFAVYQAVPWPHYLVMLAGCIWLGLLIREKRTTGRVVALVAALGLTGLYGWYTLSYSSYVPRDGLEEGRVIAGLGEALLANQDGQPTPLLEAASQATLVVFYRGFW